MKSNFVGILKKPLLPYIIIVTAVVTSFIYYHSNIRYLTGVDIGPRIVAAAAIVNKQPAYFYAEPSNVADTLKRLNGCPSTPFVALLNYPVSQFSNCQITQIWLVVQYILLLLCAIFIIAFTADPIKRYIQCIVFVIFFLLPQYWFYHLYNGQIYVFYTLLFFLMYALKSLKKEFLFGLVLAFAVVSRPLFFPAVLAALIWYNKKSLQGLVTGFGLVGLFTLMTGSVTYWFEYAHAMKLYARQLPNDQHPQIHFWEDEIQFPGCKLGGMVNDSASFIKSHVHVGRHGGLIKPLQSYLLANNIIVINSLFFSVVALVLAMIIIAILRRQNKTLNTAQLLCAFFVVYIVGEICIPAPRGAYNFVIWSFGTFLIISKGNYLEAALVVLGLLLNIDIPYINHGREWGEVLMLLGCFIFLFKKHEITNGQNLAKFTTPNKPAV